MVSSRPNSRPTELYGAAQLPSTSTRSPKCSRKSRRALSFSGMRPAFFGSGIREPIERRRGGRQIVLGGAEDVALAVRADAQRLELEAVVHLEPGPVVVELLDGRDPHLGHLVAVLADLLVGVLAVPVDVELLAMGEDRQPPGPFQRDRPANVVQESVVGHGTPSGLRREPIF